MTTRSPSTRVGLLYVGLLVAALLLAGVVSYAASPAPDGLDSVTRTGCQVVETNGEEQLQGRCIAQHAGEHATGGSPLAGYAVGGDEGRVGLAGVVGVVVTLLVAGGVFRVLRRRSRPGPGRVE